MMMLLLLVFSEEDSCVLEHSPSFLEVRLRGGTFWKLLLFFILLLMFFLYSFGNEV